MRSWRLEGIAGTVALIALLGGCGGGAGRISGTQPRPPAPPFPAAPSFVGHGRRQVGDTTIHRLLRLGLPIYCGGHRGHAVALTFDDGPGVYTSLAIRKLTRAGERATFFDVGRSIDHYPGYLRRELRIAAIGDHTYTHPVLIALTRSQITWQLKATAHKIEARSGRHVELFRPPYGLHNASVDGIANRLGLLQILWNVDSQDSLGANYTQIIRHVEAGLHPGAIILMHENRGQTIRALTTLLRVLHRHHLHSVSVPALLAAAPRRRRRSAGERRAAQRPPPASVTGPEKAGAGA